MNWVTHLFRGLNDNPSLDFNDGNVIDFIRKIIVNKDARFVKNVQIVPSSFHKILRLIMNKQDTRRG